MNSRRFSRSNGICCPLDERGSIPNCRGSSQGLAAVQNFSRPSVRSGQPRKSPSGPLCQLPPATDIPGIGRVPACATTRYPVQQSPSLDQLVGGACTAGLRQLIAAMTALVARHIIRRTACWVTAQAVARDALQAENRRHRSGRSRRKWPSAVLRSCSRVAPMQPHRRQFLHALPRSRSQGKPGRKPIRPGRCVSSSRLPPAASTTSPGV